MLVNRFVLAILLGTGLLDIGAWAQPPVPDGKGDRPFNAPPRANLNTSGSTGNGIDYHGGPVLLGTVNIYYIWYGNWSGNSATTILTNFANSIGGSPYYNINTTYFDGAGASVSNAVHFAGVTTDAYSRGTALADSDVQAVVSSAISSGRLPLDTNGVYFVLTSADVTETSGFCSLYCGWHDFASINGSNIKYSFVGNGDRCPLSCYTQSPGPNGNAGADGMASVIAHELEESATDPNLNAWWNTTTGEENADQCVWTFGDTYRASNGALANMKLGGADYLIQQNWVNAAGGYCGLSFSSLPDFYASASPSSLTVIPGSSASSTINVTALNGFSSSVTLSLSGLPGAASSNLSSPATLTPGTSFPLMLNTGTAATGTYPLTLTSTSGGLTHTTPVSMTIVPEFQLSVWPFSLSVAQGNSTTPRVSVVSLIGFTGTVGFSVSGLPSGATASFNPTTATCPGSTTITIAVSSATPVGSYLLWVAGTSGSVMQTVPVELNVTSAADFSLSASPTSISATQSSSMASSITVTSLNGFTGSVGLSVSGLPSGATASFSPTSVSGSGPSTMTLATNSSTPVGSYALTVTAASGSLSHSTSVTLAVTSANTGDFSLSASPTSVNVTQGSSGTSKITVNQKNGFTGTVSFGVAGLPAGVTASFSPGTVTISGSTVMTLLASSTIPPGSYRLTMTGTSGTLIHSISVELVVKPAGSFSLAANPTSLTISRSAEINPNNPYSSATIAVTSVNGFNGNVNLSAGGLPSGVIAAFGPNPVAVPLGNTGTSTTTITVSPNTPTGSHNFTVTGASSGVPNAKVNVILNVTN